MAGQELKRAPQAAADFDALLASIRSCRVCRDVPRGAALPHEPRPVIRARPSARLGIVGQAPGTKVHASGLPFTDASGDRLRDWMGIDRETFYDDSRVAIVPMGFCYPGQDGKGADLPPRRECAPLWRHLVFPHLANLRAILAVGLYAHAYHLGGLARGNLTDTVAAWREIMRETARTGLQVIPLPHPSWRNNGWIRKNPWFEAELLPVVRQVVAEALA